jgi:hypothetical protein
VTQTIAQAAKAIPAQVTTALTTLPARLATIKRQPAMTQALPYANLNNTAKRI